MKDPTRTFRRRGLDEDGKRLASEAYRLWRELALKRGNPYSDHQYCLRAGWAAVEATRWEDGLVVLEAIRQHMDEKSVPARIPEWARVEGGKQRETAHNARKEIEKAERNTVVEHQGVKWLGHVPNLGPEGRCVIAGCGRYARDHRLAQRSELRPIGDLLPRANP